MTPAIGWQDLKDLFRAAGEVVRADINIDHSTGISKGTGVVVMSSKSEADAAIGECRSNTIAEHVSDNSAIL